MHQPVLVVMAAGMGSRFGGLKQIQPVDDQGHIIMDFSLYDAKQAGVNTVIFVIKKSMEAEFYKRIGRRMEQHFQVYYVFQELDCLPDGFSVPEGRTKPWGTGHAIACAASVLNEPFAVINADDYYGSSAIKAIIDYLRSSNDENIHAMIGYRLRNTVTDHGHVARGICQVEDGMLKGITERTHIEKRGENAAYTEDGNNYRLLSGNTVVSMNLWGFQPSILPQVKMQFLHFLQNILPEDPLKREFYLPTVADVQIRESLGTVQVLPTNETWYGVTYKEDLPGVINAIQFMKEQGRYPTHLWEDRQ